MEKYLSSEGAQIRSYTQDSSVFSVAKKKVQGPRVLPLGINSPMAQGVRKKKIFEIGVVGPHLAGP